MVRFARFGVWGATKVMWVEGKWGARQNGFEELSEYQSKRVQLILDKLLTKGKVKRTLSKKENPINKIKELKWKRTKVKCS